MRDVESIGSHAGYLQVVTNTEGITCQENELQSDAAGCIQEASAAFRGAGFGLCRFGLAGILAATLSASLPDMIARSMNCSSV